MNEKTKLLENVRCVLRLYERAERSVCVRCGLSLTEVDIIAFLHNNPERDTAADIVELRMMQKGNVSQAVESLMCKGMVRREPDGGDRRRIHLKLTAAAESLTPEIAQARENLVELLLRDFTPEEREQYLALTQRLFRNAAAAAQEDLA